MTGNGTPSYAGHPRWAGIPLVFLTEDTLAAPPDPVTHARPDGHTEAIAATAEAAGRI